jgi:hypothetical protein
MKNFIAVAMISCLALSACAKSKVIDGKEYKPYGLVTQERADPKIQYEISFADVVMGAITCETFFIPAYILGWDIMEPVSKKEVKS